MVFELLAYAAAAMVGLALSKLPAGRVWSWLAVIAGAPLGLVAGGAVALVGFYAANIGIDIWGRATALSFVIGFIAAIYFRRGRFSDR